MENQKIEVFQSLVESKHIMRTSISLRLNLALLQDDPRAIDPSSNLATAKLIRLYDTGHSEFIDGYARQLTRLLEPYIADRLTIGFEIHNKAGEMCRPHYHIHFISNSPKETIRQALRRYFVENDMTFKSKTDYSLSSRDVSETNMKKHFRYPLKMNYPLFTLCHGFSLEELRVLQTEAQAHLTNVRDHLSDKIEKKSRPTLCDELFDYLDDALQDHPFSNDLCVHKQTHLLVYAIPWMDTNNKDFTGPTIIAKVNRYLRLRGYMTVLEYIGTLGIC